MLSQYEASGTGCDDGLLTTTVQIPDDAADRITFDASNHVISISPSGDGSVTYSEPSEALSFTLRVYVTETTRDVITEFYKIQVEIFTSSCGPGNLVS